MRNREDEGKALSLDHVVTTLNWEDRSMHSELILSPVQTLSLTSAIRLGLPGHKHGVSVHLSSPNLENGKKNEDPLLGVWERAKMGKLSWEPEAGDASGVMQSGAPTVTVTGRAMSAMMEQEGSEQAVGTHRRAHPGGRLEADDVAGWGPRTPL